MYWVFIFVLGTIFGSFSHLVVDRNLRDESIVNPPSHCPICKKKLSYRDLVPIFSYIGLGGKCRYCKSKIPIAYLIYEITGGCLSILAFKENFNLSTILIFISYILSFIIAMIDVKSLYLDMNHIYVLSGLGFLYRSFYIGFDLDFFIKVVIFSLIFLLIYVGSRKNVGDGDYFFYVSIFLFLENEKIFSFVILSIWIGAIFAIGIAIERKSLKIMIGFCIYIFIAYLVAMNL